MQNLEFDKMEFSLRVETTMLIILINTNHLGQAFNMLLNKKQNLTLYSYLNHTSIASSNWNNNPQYDLQSQSLFTEYIQHITSKSRWSIHLMQRE